MDLYKYIEAAVNYHHLMVESMIKQRCTNCKYAKVCNPRRNVTGIVMKPVTIENPTHMYYTTHYDIKFVCYKFKVRNAPVKFEETRIFVIKQKLEGSHD